MRIPYISSLRKYSVQDFKPEEIKRTEEIMLEILDWNTQFGTLIDVIEYFLSQGIIFSNDQVSLSQDPEIKEASNFMKLQKQTSQQNDRQINTHCEKQLSKFQSRVEKSKSVMENGNDRSFLGRNGGEGETAGEEGGQYRMIREMGERQVEDLVNKMEKEAKRLTSVLIKGGI